MQLFLGKSLSLNDYLASWSFCNPTVPYPTLLYPFIPYLTRPYSNPSLPYPVNDILTYCNFSYFPLLMFWGLDLVLIASVCGHCLYFNPCNIVISWIISTTINCAPIFFRKRRRSVVQQPHNWSAPLFLLQFLDHTIPLLPKSKILSL